MFVCLSPFFQLAFFLSLRFPSHCFFLHFSCYFVSLPWLFAVSVVRSFISLFPGGCLTNFPFPHLLSGPFFLFSCKTNVDPRWEMKIKWMGRNNKTCLHHITCLFLSCVSVFSTTREVLSPSSENLRNTVLDEEVEL